MTDPQFVFSLRDVLVGIYQDSRGEQWIVGVRNVTDKPVSLYREEGDVFYVSAPEELRMFDPGEIRYTPGIMAVDPATVFGPK